MNYLQEFLKRHPIYETIKFHSVSNPAETHLHPILPASQAIIDSMIEAGHNRIAIVFPDDDINVLPLIVSKFLSNIQELPGFAHSILEEIEPGQHLKLGKAVVEFVSFDKGNKRIELHVGKPTRQKYGTTVYTLPPARYLSPFQGYHLYFERSTGAFTKEATYLEERKRIQQKFDEDGMADIDLLALKRTVLNRSVVVLSPKKDFRVFLENFFVSGRRFPDVLTYGEFDPEAERGTKLYNSGQLDCLPGIIVSPKISEIATSISSEGLKNQIDAIVVSQSKYNEAINNLSDFRKCLRTGIPVIMFVPETEYESFPVLAEMGFEFWNWDPNMLNFGGLSSKLFVASDNSMFGKLSKKVYNAATSEVELKTIKYEGLKKANGLVRQLVKQTFDSGNPMNQITRRINKIGKECIDLASPVSDSVYKSIIAQFEEVNTIMLTLKAHYEGTDIWKDTQASIELLKGIIERKDTPKSMALSEVIKSSVYKNTIVLVPNRYMFIDELQRYLSMIYSGERVLVMNASDFFRKQAVNTVETDHLIVTFFDQSEYLRIKKSYCYKKLTYLLYSFENAWRRGFVNKFETCIQRENVKNQARRIISRQVVFTDWEPMEPVDAEEMDDVDEITEFDFERELITNIIKRNNTSAERSDAAECVPVVFNQDTIGYLSPNHNLIDITLLCRGELDRPVKKEASKLSKGDIVLIRQSDKDIIYDKANELMTRRGELSIRSTAELWVIALQKFAKGKSLATIKEIINGSGANCEINQIRYWLNGDTICPENGSVVKALSVLCPDILPEESVPKVLSAGAKVQEYHREAGRWLTNELRYKAGNILDIYQSGDTKGHIDEIGDVHVYVVESVFDREYVDRNKINRLEVIS